MSEFEPPRNRRERARVEGVRLVLDAFSERRELAARYSAALAIHGDSEQTAQAKERLEQFRDRTNGVTIDARDPSET